MQAAKGSSVDKSLIEELRHLQIFRQLTKADLESMLNCMQDKHHEMGKVLFQTGEPYNNSLRILYRGRIGLWGPHGERYEVDPGAILGLTNYLDGLPFVFTAIALTPISLLVIKDTDRQELERLCPVLYRLLNRLIAGQIRSQHSTRQSFTGGMTRPAKTAMKTPLATCGPDISLGEAYRIMDERKIGSLVLIGDNEELLGVLTFAGLSEAVLVRGASPDDNIMNAACETAYTVASDTPLWKVEEIQHRHSLKYVIVTEGNRPLGMISQADILHSLLSQSGGIHDQVRGIKTIAGLAQLAKRVLPIAKDARERNHYASTAVRTISEFHLALQRRCIKLTLKKMLKNGLGSPPVKFSLLIMGSGGRKEMMLYPDQDNGIVIGDGSEKVNPKTLDWFKEFAMLLNQHRQEIGFLPCFEDNFADKPILIWTFEQWRSQTDQIISAPGKEAANWIRLILDSDTLYGDSELAELLHAQVLTEFKDNPQLAKIMVNDNAEWRPALGFFNQLIPMGFFNTQGGAQAKGKIDIKCNGLDILADIVRIYASKAGIRHRNTSERLMGLVRQGKLSLEYANSVRAAYEALLDMLVSHQIQRAEKGKRLNRLIKPNQLTAIDHEILRMAMRVIKGFQEKLQTDFK